MIARMGIVPVSLWAIAALAGTAVAGLGDTPLPQFSDGTPSTLVANVSGVVKRDRLQTVFLCTSLDNAPIHVGVETFDADGVLLNRIDQGVGEVLDVAPGGTVTFGTTATATFVETELIPSPSFAQGSARIVAASQNVRCNVVVLDDLVTPPVTAATLGPAARPQTGALPPTVALPQFSDGKPATHVAPFAGVIARGNAETAVLCTSVAAEPVDIGVELLVADGTVANSIADGNGAALDVTPGRTVTFGTTGSAALLEDVIVVTPAIAQGLARVVTTSADVLCAALVFDAGLAPPTAMSALAGPSTPGPTLARALPQFSDGKPSVHVRTVPGVMKRGQLQTVFACSSLADAPVDVGVEVFGFDGTPLNDVSAGVGAVLDVAPGATVTLSTSTTATYLETAVIPLQDGAQGVGRIVASAEGVLCNVMVVDDLVTPPVSLMTLGEPVVPAAGGLPSAVALPQFSDGHAATHAAYFPGVVKRADAETDVLCTSLAAQPIDVGVEIFTTSGAPANDVAAGNGAVVGVAPGATVVIGTTGTAALFETTVITMPGLAQGMARVVADSPDLLCSAILLDASVTPPAVMSSLVGFGAEAGPTVCGDGIVGGTEECDDGDTAWVRGEGCDAGCRRVTCGDPDDGGTIVTADALFVLRTAVGLETCAACICDVDSSGGASPVTAGDALRLLRKAVGGAVDVVCPVCG